MKKKTEDQAVTIDVPKSSKKNKTDQVKTVEPIRCIDDIESMQSALKKISQRDYMIFLVGITTALRISDILKLKVKDVRGADSFWIGATKTHKARKVHVNEDLRAELDGYVLNMSDDSWLFPSKRNKEKPVDKIRVYRVLNQAGKEVGIKTKIGTHSMRKSFGYHFYKQTKDIAELQTILQHESPSVTMKYIGITDESTENACRTFSYKRKDVPK